ncbi:MAG TPA: HNH endonuclease signature motif containing protein [Nocardioidaceae bacterium]|nr:HNH endonuclease signature motif containing protein [Nocardioidaceae bacterium]
MGIDTSHFRRPIVRGLGGPPRRTAANTLKRMDEGRRREKPEILTRALMEIGRPYACDLCGVDGSWQGAPLTLDVDHIDGDFLNNEAENLRFLCPNCHRQTPNFAGRSKNRYIHAGAQVARALS